MTDPNDHPWMQQGGPAFPCVSLTTNFKGMTLRDWFAGQALAAIIAKHAAMGEYGSPDNGRSVVSEAFRREIQKAIAIGAYQYADAMLAARKGGDA